MHSRPAARHSSASKSSARPFTRLARLILLCLLAACAGYSESPGSAAGVDAVSTFAGPRDCDAASAGDPSLACAPERETPLAVARRVDVMLAPAATVSARDLIATLQPRDGASLIQLDDLDSFAVRVHEGEVRLSTKQLDRLFNEHVFTGPQAMLRRMRFKTRADRLTLSGEYRLRGWVKFSVSGRLVRTGPMTLALHSDDVRVDGMPVADLLDRAHVRLDDILPLATTGVRLDGNVVRLNLETLLPGPQIRFELSDVAITDDALVMRFDDGRRIRPPRPAEPVDSHILVQGGTIGVGPLRLPDARLQLVARDADRLSLSLPGYRRQLAAGEIDLRPGVRPSVFMVRMATLPPEVPASPPARETETRDPEAPIWLQARRAMLWFGQAIGVQALDLAARLAPAEPGGTVDLDDAESFVVHVARGCVRMAPDAIERLFNTHVLDYQPRALQELRITIDDRDRLVITGGLKLWGWLPPFPIPFRTVGAFELDDQGLLRYTPDRISALHIPAGPLLDMLPLSLEGLIDLERPGARVDDGTIILDIRNLLPAPRISTRPSQIALDARGLTLCFDGEEAAPEMTPPDAAGSGHIWLRGGEVKTLGQTIVDARILVSAPDERLVLRAADHRSQVAAGRMVLRTDGTLMLTVPPPPAPDRPASSSPDDATTTQ